MPIKTFNLHLSRHRQFTEQTKGNIVIVKVGKFKKLLKNFINFQFLFFLKIWLKMTRISNFVFYTYLKNNKKKMCYVNQIHKASIIVAFKIFKQCKNI